MSKPLQRLYTRIQERRRSRSRSRSRSPSPEPDFSSSPVNMNEPCRECQLGTFCYNHPRDTTTQAVRSSANPIEKSEVTTQQYAKPTASNKAIPSPQTTGKFERSQVDEDTTCSTSMTTNVKGQQTQDSTLPRIQVNGVEIPYWVKSR